MAKINFGNGVTDIRGSSAGNTFSKNAAGAYMKKKSSPNNQMTPAQLALRSNMAQITQAGNALTSGLKQAWTNYAAQNPRTNAFGNPYTLTWLQMFNSVNGILLQIGEALRTTPPPSAEVQVIVPTPADTDISAGAQTIEMEFAPATDANTKVWVRMTPPLNAGIINVNNLYKVVGFSTVSQSAPITLPIPPNIGVVATGERVSLRVFTVDIRNGRLSQAFDFIKTIIA